MKSLNCIFHILDRICPPAQQEKNKQNSKDKAIMVEEEIEKDNNEESKEGNSLIKEGNKDELKEETHIVQDIDQGNEDIEELILRINTLI